MGVRAGKLQFPKFGLFLLVVGIVSASSLHLPEDSPGLARKTSEQSLDESLNTKCHGQANLNNRNLSDYASDMELAEDAVLPSKYSHAVLRPNMAQNQDPPVVRSRLTIYSSLSRLVGISSADSQYLQTRSLLRPSLWSGESRSQPLLRDDLGLKSDYTLHEAITRPSGGLVDSDGLAYNLLEDPNGNSSRANGTREDDEWDRLVRLFKSHYPVETWMTLGHFDDAYLKLINPHWMSYEPASALTHHFLAGLYVLLMVLGCSGNGLVIFMFIRCRSLRTPANYLILNLALSDFLMLAKTPIFMYNSFYEGPALGAIGCKIYGFVGGLSGTASIMSLTGIALDRYSVILHPLNPLKKTTHYKALLMILLVWLYSALFAGLPLLGLNNYVPEGILTSCSFDYLSTSTPDRLFIFVYFLAAWLLPVSVIVFAYYSIFRVVIQAERLDFFKGGGAGTPKESFRNSRRKETVRREVRIAIISSVIIGIWVLAWTPYAIVALLGIFGQSQLLSPLVSAIPALFCKSASCIDPFVYAISHPRFKRELRDLLSSPCLFPAKPSSTRRSPETENNRSLVTYSEGPEDNCSINLNSDSGDGSVGNGGQLNAEDGERESCLDGTSLVEMCGSSLPNNSPGTTMIRHKAHNMTSQATQELQLQTDL